MDFDPNAAPRERKRSGPRWYSRVAFFVIALLLLLNAVAMFVNAEANGEQACYARADIAADLRGAFLDCDKKYGRGDWAESD